MGGLIRCGPCGKQMFGSEEAAKDKLAEIAEYDDHRFPGQKPVRAYYEPRCKFWHLTSKPLRGNQRKAAR